MKAWRTSWDAASGSPAAAVGGQISSGDSVPTGDSHPHRRHVTLRQFA